MDTSRPPITRRAYSSTRLVSYDRVDCVPCWKDINPRVGASYDLFGTGKTAIKASIGRYVSGGTIDIATANDPITTSINQVTRSWTDTNGNFLPDCNLRSPDLNGECGPLSNRNFGQSNITTRYDPDVLTGWGKRGYNWQAAAMIEHELRPGVAVSAGYFRTWYGNFLVTDNLEVTPQDFDHYCINAPSDPRLPGGGNQNICGLYNVTPVKFGRVNSLVTFASNYGKQTEIYNGVDFMVSARLPRGAQLTNWRRKHRELSEPRRLQFDILNQPLFCGRFAARVISVRRAGRLPAAVQDVRMAPTAVGSSSQRKLSDATRRSIHGAL